MRAGRLRHRVLIQKPADTGDSVTDHVPEYVDVAWRNAQIRPVTAKEIFAAQGFVGQLDVVVVIRYEPLFDDLDNHWRLWHQNRRLAIVGKLNIDMHDRWLKIITTGDPSDLRLRTEAFDAPLHETVHVVLPGLTDDTGIGKG